MSKSLKRKLKNIRRGKYTSQDFIIADAKDGDMAMGMAAPGPDRTTAGRFLTREDYLEGMRSVTRSELVDIMLMSASSADILTAEGLFENSPVTPAARLNDTTDIWVARGNRYNTEASRPFRTADLKKVSRIVPLGLYSITFSNNLERDLENALEYRKFREQACEVGIDHFLEVFNSNVDCGLALPEQARFINDSIARILAGQMLDEQPLFLKIAYNGPEAMEELASYDPSRLIVGILGGSAGTTRDTFELVTQAEKYGARVALFGRKINLADDPVELIRHMRACVEKDMTTEEAVRSYHAELDKKGIAPSRPVDEDVEITEAILKG